MKQPVTILIKDVGQPRRDADNLIQLDIVDEATGMPFLKVQLQRVEIAKLMHPKWVGHLNSKKLDGFIVT